MSKGIPVPDAKWTVPVDADGNPIVGRALREGDFLARPPIVFAPPKTVLTDQSLLPREKAENTKWFNWAIFELSQMEVGRHLLELIREKNIGFVYDEAEAVKEDAAVLNAFLTNEIIIRPGIRALILAIYLGHEGQHVHDNNYVYPGTTLLKLGYHIADTLPTAIRIRRVQEANARVAMALIIFESIIDKPGDNPWRYKPPFTDDFIDAVFSKTVAAGVKRAAPFAQQGNLKRAAQIVFESFFEDAEALAFCDSGTTAEFLFWFPRQVNLKNPNLEFMTVTRMDHAEVAEVVNINGLHYLEGWDFLNNPVHSTLNFNPEFQTTYAKKARANYTELKKMANALGPTHPCHPVIDWESREAHDRILVRGKSNITSTDSILPEAALPAVLGRPATPQPTGASIAA